MALGMRRLQVAFAGFLSHSAFRGSLGLPACDSARHDSACRPDNRYPDWKPHRVGRLSCRQTER